MQSTTPHSEPRDRGQRGQIIVIAALAMIAIIGGVSLILEGGNAYAHQRVVQNAADSVANAGAATIGQRLGGGGQVDADVLSAMTAMATANKLDSFTGYYTDVKGNMLTPLGVITTDRATAERVGPADGGDTTIPPLTQGVTVGGSQTFPTTFARAIGLSQFTASADATARAGPLTGGLFMPVVFPVSLANCDGSGNVVVVDEPWRMSNPDPTNNEAHPIGQEYIVPLCKTGGGSFAVLDLDPTKTCEEEVTSPSAIQFIDFPIDVASDNGNDCAKKINDAVTANTMHGDVVLIPICDGDCVTTGGSHATYHIIRIAAFFLDYMADKNGGNDPACAYTTSPSYGTSLVNVTGGNGSSSCMVGWFVRWVTSGPVGTGTINNGEAVGVQLIR